LIIQKQNRYFAIFLHKKSRIIFCEASSTYKIRSVVKRGVIGVYHYWSRRHMQKYIDEFVYRFNRRELTNREKFDRLLENLEYRLTYKELVYGK
jgi:hypothetical protein